MFSMKEISEKMGLNPNAIRFYEKKGLLTPRRTESNYRKYSNEDIARLEMITLYRKMGFSVENIKELLDKKEGSIEQFVTQYTALNHHIHNMIRIRETLGNCIERMLNDEVFDEEMVEQIADTAKIIALSENWRDQWNFDRLASDYDTFIRESVGGLDFYKNYDLVLDKTAEKIQTGIVAEIGIGTGNLAKRIVEGENQVKEYIGIDQSLNMLKEAKKKCKNVQLRKGDFLNLPLESKSCDAIVTSYAFHHCDSQEKKLAIEEMNRVLKSEGTIVITDLMFENQNARSLFEANCSEKERIDLEDEYFGNVDEVSEILEELEFNCEAEQIDELIWSITACK